MLTRFYVRDADTPRNSPFTFEPNGFYKTLKSRVVEIISAQDREPALKSSLFIDFLGFSTLVLSALAARNESYIIAVLAGAFLCATVICAHNFFHQRDNWRMYYFNLSLLSAKDWRVSHALSHHLFPNSLHDLEITLFEPILKWLPDPNKSVTASYISWLYSPVVYAFIFHAQGITRLLVNPEGATEFIPLILPASIMVLGGVSLTNTLFYWTIIIIISSFFFGLIGVNAAHHHPDIFHDGDCPRTDKDWGLYQMDAVKDRVEIKGSLPLVLMSFGDHTLHHMFPTLDHAHLDRLYPVFEQTCKEFGYNFQFTTIWELFKGQFLQLARTTPNPIPHS